MSVAEDCRAGASTNSQERFGGFSPESTSTFDLFSFYNPLDTAEEASATTDNLFDFSSDVSELIASAVAAFPGASAVAAAASTLIPAAEDGDHIPTGTDSQLTVGATKVSNGSELHVAENFDYYSHYALQQSEDAGIFDFDQTTQDAIANSGMATMTAYPYVAVPVVAALQPPPQSLTSALSTLDAPMMTPFGVPDAPARTVPYVMRATADVDARGTYMYAVGATGQMPPMDYYGNVYAAATCTTAATTEITPPPSQASLSASGRIKASSASSSTPRRSRKKTPSRATVATLPKSRNKQTTDELVAASAAAAAANAVAKDDDDDVVFERFVTPVDSFMHGPGIITGSTPAAEPLPPVERPSKRRAVAAAAAAAAKEAPPPTTAVAPWTAAFMDVAAGPADQNTFLNAPGWWV